MTRAYYTNLNAARYMSSEFGLTYEPVQYVLGEPRYYVVSDHILWPQPGDMILLPDGNEAYTRERNAHPLDRGEKIIMRGGKSFIPPIVEAS
jgi:hypothetical protein